MQKKPLRNAIATGGAFAAAVALLMAPAATAERTPVPSPDVISVAAPEKPETTTPLAADTLAPHQLGAANKAARDARALASKQTTAQQAYAARAAAKKAAAKRAAAKKSAKKSASAKSRAASVKKKSTAKRNRATRSFVRGPVTPTSGYVSCAWGCYWGHRGLDFAAPTGTAVRAARSGVVRYAGWYGGGHGIRVVIDHGNGLQTAYSHLSSISTWSGQYVSAGEHIAGVGSTGNSSGPHLHFEVHSNGNKINPAGWLW